MRLSALLSVLGWALFPSFAGAAECVVIGAGGELIASGAFDPSAPCGLVVSTAAEFQRSADFSQVFGVPDATQVQTAFAAAFSLPLILYISAWALGVVVNWFTPEHDRP